LRKILYGGVIMQRRGRTPSQIGPIDWKIEIGSGRRRARWWRDAAVWAAIAAFFSAVAALASVYYSARAERVALQGQLREQMMRYLTDNLQAAEELKDPYSLPGYLALKAKDRRRVEVVAGLQIGVVDLMFDTDDPRRTKWIDFLAIPGPIACWEMTLYAVRPETIDAIKRAETRLRPGVDCREPVP
jgi:hypothetical protein